MMSSSNGCGMKEFSSGFSTLSQLCNDYSYLQRTPSLKDEASKTDDGMPKVALVIGVTGIVGSCLAEILHEPDLPGGPWKMYGVARRQKPDWLADSPFEYVRCDVLDREETLEKISTLTDVTHLFWVAWVSRSTEEENCRDNGCMLQNVLDALLPNALNFQHICLQTGGKHYSAPFSLIGKVQVHEPPFHEDLPRLPLPNFYYVLEDIVYDAASKKEGLTWSVHRPGAIIGFSPMSLMNVLGSLAVYATICKWEGLPFRYPGNQITWERFMTVSDAELIAEQEIWAATEPHARNQAYNIVNGDVINFKSLWQLLGSQFGLAIPPCSSEPVHIAELMKDKGPIWDAIVVEHGLRPTSLEEVGNWWFVDLMLNRHGADLLLSMNKSKELGFLGYRNTQTSVIYWINRMREKKIIPRTG
eukprot:c28681_g1_i1 orf=529-1776(-)